MKNKKGITLISLVITVIVLSILASIATYSGVSVIQSAKLTTFTTELKIMQTQINNIYEENKTAEIGTEITGDIQTQANLVFDELAKDTTVGITTSDGYRYWSKELIKQLGIEGIEQDFFVNLEKRSVVSYQGLEYEGKRYYTLSQLPNGLYNVEYEEPSVSKPTFDVNVENIGTDKWRVTISNIDYKGYIDKWEVQYQLPNKEYWTTTQDMIFIVYQSGTYKIKITNNGIESEEKQIVIQ